LILVSGRWPLRVRTADTVSDLRDPYIGAIGHAALGAAAPSTKFCT
jgi:hypothetical protein